MALSILASLALATTLWTDSKRTMIVPLSRLTPAAREVYRANSAQRERLLISAVAEHPEDWSLLCVARAWREDKGTPESFRKIAAFQWKSAAQRRITSSLGKRSNALREWWDREANGSHSVGFSAALNVNETLSAEEACLVLDAQSRSLGRLAQMRTFATASITKFGEHPALIAWRARARANGYYNAYPDGDPRSKKPDGVPPDTKRAIIDAKRAAELAPKDPGITIVAADILMRANDSGGPSLMIRYVAMNDPWSERRARIKREYPAFFR